MDPLHDPTRRLESIRALQRLLDTAFRVPGTGIRFGWDAIIGLIPWAGDLATALMASAIIFQAHQLRVPRVVQLRMLLNVGFDLLIGLVPFVGDVADVFWKSNTKNLGLLDRYMPVQGRVPPATPGDWAFVAGVLGAIALMAVIPFMLFGWLLSELGRGLF